MYFYKYIYIQTKKRLEYFSIQKLSPRVKYFKNKLRNFIRQVSDGFYFHQIRSNDTSTVVSYQYEKVFKHPLMSSDLEILSSQNFLRKYNLITLSSVFSLNVNIPHELFQIPEPESSGVSRGELIGFQPFPKFNVNLIMLSMFQGETCLSLYMKNVRPQLPQIKILDTPLPERLGELNSVDSAVIGRIKQYGAENIRIYGKSQKVINIHNSQYTVFN